MSYEQVANRVEIVMWVALLFCAVEVVRGGLKWRSGGQESLSSGLFASLAPVVFLLRHVPSRALWLALVAVYAPIVIWRLRLWRRRQRDASQAGVTDGTHFPTRLAIVVAVCDVAVAVLAIWLIGNPVAVVATILLVNAFGVVGALRPLSKSS